MKKIILLILFIFIPLYVQAQNCPCKYDQTFLYLQQKPMSELSRQDFDYIRKIETQCAEQILPNYLDCFNWSIFYDDELQSLYYNKKTFTKTEDMINVWIRDRTILDNVVSEFVDIENIIFYPNSRTYQIKSRITLTGERTVLTADIYGDEIKEIAPNSIIDAMLENLLDK